MRNDRYSGNDVVYRVENPHAKEGRFPLFDQGSIMTTFFSVLIGLMAVSDAAQPFGALFEGMSAANMIWDTMTIEPKIEVSVIQ